MSQRIPVEVVGSFGEYHQAFIHKLSSNKEIAFLAKSSDAPSNVNELIDVPVVRLRRPVQSGSPGESVYKIGEAVEVCITSSQLAESALTTSANGGLSSLTQQLESMVHSDCSIFSQPGYFEARVTKDKKHLYGVDIYLRLNNSLPSIGTFINGHGESLRFPDIVEVSQIRPPNENPHLKPDSFHTSTINLPQPMKLRADDEILVEYSNYLKGEGIFDDSQCESEGVLLFHTLNETLHRRIQLLQSSFIRILQQKMDQILKRGHEQTLHFEQFSVDEELVGMAIGVKGKNIDRVRSITGVVNAKYDDETKSFHISAETTGALKEARSQLEYVREYIQVPEQFVGYIVGRSGAVIQEVVHKSGVHRVNILNRKENANLTDATISPPFVEGHEAFMIVGLRQQVEDARMIIEFNVDLIRDLDRSLGRSGINYGGSFSNRETSLPPRTDRTGRRGVGGNVLRGGQKRGAGNYGTNMRTGRNLNMGFAQGSDNGYDSEQQSFRASESDQNAQIRGRRGNRAGRGGRGGGPSLRKSLHHSTGDDCNNSPNQSNNESRKGSLSRGGGDAQGKPMQNGDRQK